MGLLKGKPSSQSLIPQIKWKCPPKFLPNCKWLMAAGEESEEAETQKQREMRVHEAVYLHPFDIPPSPYVTMDVQEAHVDDAHVPLIPTTVIEEGVVGPRSDMAAPQNASFYSRGSQVLVSANCNVSKCDPPRPYSIKKSVSEVLPGFQGDVIAAAIAALNTIMKSKEEGSLIDTDLLIKFFSDPKMIEKLISEQRARDISRTEFAPLSKTLTVSVPMQSSQLVLAEEVIIEDGGHAKGGSIFTCGPNLVTPMVARPDTKPEPEIKKLTKELIAGTGAVPVSGSQLVMPSPELACPKPEQVVENLFHKQESTTDTGGLHVSVSKPWTSGIACSSTRPNQIVKELLYEHGLLSDAGSAAFSVVKLATSITPETSLPGSKLELEKIRRMINAYGALGNTEIDPSSRSLPSTLQAPLLSTEPDVGLPVRIDLLPSPNMRENGLQLEALSPSLISPNLNAISNAVQQDLGLKPLSPYSSGLNFPPLKSVAQPIYGLKAQSPKIAHSSVVPATAATLKDVNYVKDLIRQHGQMHETISQTCKFHVQELKFAPILKPSALTQKLHKPCIYFNSARGCRNGSNCSFRHDTGKSLRSGGGQGALSSKRMKLGRGFSWT